MGPWERRKAPREGGESGVPSPTFLGGERGGGVAFSCRGFHRHLCCFFLPPSLFSPQSAIKGKLQELGAYVGKLVLVIRLNIM